MTVFFMGPSTQFSKNIETYRKLAEAVERLDWSLSIPIRELNFRESSSKGSALDKEDWEIMCQRELRLVAEADKVIVDATDKSTFGVGYLAAIALQLEKPTLFLLRKGSLEGSIITGLEHPHVVRRKFTDATISNIVTEFLGKGSVQ